MSDFDYESHDALGLAELVRRGEVRAEELLEAALARIEARDATLGAVVIPTFERARAAVAAGLPEGPFRGVPFLEKDLYAQIEGVPSTNGCRFYRDCVPAHSNALVRRHERAGLVILGKSHSPEFGVTPSSESALYGVTRNPWDLEHTPGGSSGGGAAAVAAGLVPIAHATDGGGSIRIPASCCGLFGMKPTRARNPVGPDVGEGWSGMSVGHAVTRSVRDSAALLDATCGEDPGAPYCAPARARPFLEEVGADPGRLRVAVTTRAFNGVDTHPDCVTAVEEAARLCRELGHEVREAAPSVEAEALADAARVIVAANVRANLEERAEAIGRAFTEADVEPVTWMLVQAAVGANATRYARALRTIHAVGRRVASFFEDHDVLLTPTMAAPPPKLGRLSLSSPDLEDYLAHLNRAIGFSQLMNAAGNPAMSLPLHWNGAGLPIGVQFAGRFGDEATLFRLAAQLEAARPWAQRRPDVRALETSD